MQIRWRLNYCRSRTFRSILLFAMILTFAHWERNDARAQSTQPLQQPMTAGSEGLQGLLPADAPQGLLATLNRLPDTWDSWNKSFTQELNEFYSNTPSSIAAQRAALDRFKTRLATVDGARIDVRYQSIRDELSGLHGALKRRIEVLEAALDTVTDSQTNSTSISEKAQLSASLERVDAFLDAAVGGQAWKTYLQTSTVRQHLSSAQDDSKLIPALQVSLRKARFARNSQAPAVRQFATVPALKDFHHDLDRTIAALERGVSGVKWDDVRGQVKLLIDGLENYESSQLREAARQVRLAYDKLRDVAPDGGDRLTLALRRHYLDTNLHVSISEAFLNRFAAQSRTEAGPVRDFILGADVYGDQTTVNHSSVDLLPSDKGAHFRISLTGEVSTSTEAVASKAVIYSAGNHQFFGGKDVFFDGDTFSTGPATVNVAASNVPVGASTQADRIPLLGGIARRMAINAANRNRPESEAIAAERTGSRVEPQFNAEVDSAFVRLNAELQDKARRPLLTENLYPDYKTARTTDTELIFNSRLMADGELGGGASPIESIPAAGIAFNIHDSLLNNALNRVDVAGKTLTETEFIQLIDQRLKKYFPGVNLENHRHLKAGKPDITEPNAMVFATTDPIRIRIVDGNVVLTIRAGFERDADQGGNIPTQIVTIPWSVTLDGDEVVMKRGDVSIDPLTPPENIAEQLVLAGVIKSRLAKSFPDRRSARSFKVDRADGESLMLRIIDIKMVDRWLLIQAE